jgi:hypothetical protein
VVAELGEQAADVAVDLVADAADPVQRLAVRVGDVPVQVAFARVDRASVAAAHGDHHVGSA